MIARCHPCAYVAQWTIRELPRATLERDVCEVWRSALANEVALVTGAAGFIGSHMCEKLLRAGHDVVGVDNFSPFHDPALKHHNVAQVEMVACESHSHFRMHEADISGSSHLWWGFSGSWCLKAPAARSIRSR